MGMLCTSEDKTEIAPCNVRSCEGEAIDGVWGEWGDWQSCSQICDGGVQSRSRMALVVAAHGGVPAEGLGEEFRPCNTASSTTDVDCIFEEWGHWSSCSCTC